MKLRLTARALSDLHEICAYIHTHNPTAARRVRDAIKASLEIIATYPHVGHIRKHGVRRFALPRYPYLIFYDVIEDANEIRVFAIRHAAREEEQS